ncbi:ExeM/NucH family extracellular endonuclease [Luteimonas sp. MC1895]|uniref:ExeM/NucH family extracellular endonuclease n=1 Tax=Luteimonas sp. MC1895 TaxID=2819513 RepID=UPI0018F064C7|nr:ExeM/NucH family extracellular endonuclease [Luteimonas sp. MC1895]MBJ6979193.1 ExeM/NucH family extracellular endonuclease [Luteimonas sp. MC1895]
MTRMNTALSLSLVLALAGCAGLASRPPAAPAPPATSAGVVDIATAPSDWSALDGRRVRITAPLVISGNHRLERDASVVAAFGERLRTPTEVALPGAAAQAVAAANRARSLTLVLAPRVARHAQVWRSGGTLEAVEGVLTVDDAGPRLALADVDTLQPATRPAAPTVEGELRLASLNLQNLFNGDGQGGGFPTARGARTPGEYAAQLARLVATLSSLDADIVALLELENDGHGAESSLAQLVAALDPQGLRWRLVDAGRGPGDNPIRVGMIYRADRVAPVGRPATLEAGPFGPLSRAPLAQAFRAGRGPAFVVVANHFKSKGCRDAAGADLDQGDGQACFNATRRASGQALRDWLAGDPTGSGSDLVAVLGDLNAYAQEDPVRGFIAAGWRDALATADAGQPYTYVYDAQAGRLDHVLLSPALGDRLQDAAIWHSNADEASNVVDPAANAGEQASSPWRASDHDPAVVGLRLRSPR